MSNTTSNPENKTPNPGTKDALKAENEALKAELEALRAQAEKDAAEKAELEERLNQAVVHQDEPDVPSATVEERVELFVEKGYANDEPNLIISVNGVMYLLPKGKTSTVPKFVADEYYRSRKAQQSLDETVEKLLAASGK